MKRLLVNLALTAQVSPDEDGDGTGPAGTGAADAGGRTVKLGDVDVREERIELGVHVGLLGSDDNVISG
jgi:hypothetical protein